MEESIGFERWARAYESADDITKTRMLRDKIIESDDLDKDSKKLFADAFEYFEYHGHKDTRPVTMELFKRYLTEVKGYKEFNFENLIRVLYLLALCGYVIEDATIKNEEVANEIENNAEEKEIRTDDSGMENARDLLGV